MLEDWRFAASPYVENGGLRAYAGVPLRLQNETGHTACLGSLCVASPTPQAPLTRALQMSLARLADWVVSDIVHLTRARRQRARRRMVDLLASALVEAESAVSEDPVIKALQSVYPDATVKLHSSKARHIQVEGRDPVPLSELASGLWEDVKYIDTFIAESNHLDLPTDRVVRIIAARCESVSGESILIVATKDFRLVFDDIDAWFAQKCASIISEMWHKRLLAEVMLAKEKFLRGFSHQLRTPLHGILGSVELLAEEMMSKNSTTTPSQAIALIEKASIAKPGGEQSLYLDTIKRAGRDLVSIINSMITLNRWADVATTERNYATYTTYDLEKEMANEILKFTSGDSRYNASIYFNHDLPPDHCTMYIDLGLLCESTLPLVINAIQNTPTGNVAIIISARPDYKELVIDVKDTGCGIPPEDHHRIFELYEQVDIYSSGAGIGLTLASKFAALLQGSIDLVSSEVNHGSHFRSTFHGIDLKYSKSHITADPLLPQLANIPKRFYTFSSSAADLSLCHHFTNFLSCYGLTASEEREGALLIIDFVADSTQLRTALSQLPSDQAVICLVRSSDIEVKRDVSFRNVVYVEGLFSTSTMSDALVRADELLARMKEEGNVQDANSRDMAVSKTFHDSSCAGRNQSLVPPGELIAPPPHIPENSTHSLTRGMELMSVQHDLRSPATTNFDNIHPEPSPVDDVSLQVLPSLPHCLFPPPETAGLTTALLVDDNAVNLRIMQMYCDKRSIPYLCARDGLEAVSAFQNHQASAASDSSIPPIHLVLMDLQMPKCDGIEATRQIRQLEIERNWGKSVLFVVSGQDSVSDRKAVAEVGGQEYYVKPVSIKTLDTGLKKYLPALKLGRQPKK